MSDDQQSQGYPSRSIKARALEDAALKMVTDQQARVRKAAHAAFRAKADPLKVFAETMSDSSVVHVNAMVQLNAAMTERIRAFDHTVQAGGGYPVLPAPDLFKILGLAPIDTFRLRAWAIVVVLTILLAAYGAGSLTGR